MALSGPKRGVHGEQIIMCSADNEILFAFIAVNLTQITQFLFLNFETNFVHYIRRNKKREKENEKRLVAGTAKITSKGANNLPFRVAAIFVGPRGPGVSC